MDDTASVYQTAIMDGSSDFSEPEQIDHPTPSSSTMLYTPLPSQPLPTDLLTTTTSPEDESSLSPSPLTGPSLASPRDRIPRGIYTPNPAGTLTFIGLRAIEPLLQSYLLSPSSPFLKLLPKLGIPVLPPSLLSPNNTPTAEILSWMGRLSRLKQAYWAGFIAREPITPKLALILALLEAAANTVNSLLYLIPKTSTALLKTVSIPLLGDVELPLPVLVGSLMFALGLAVETISERQRSFFKEEYITVGGKRIRVNEGKICDRGLWSLARHPNYGGYVLWRTGYGIAAGGWLAGLGLGLAHAGHFAGESVGLMDEYMNNRYGGAWSQHKQRVGWVLIPGIY
ncbi:hypothetical protein QBC40DRAFT_209086 [Triangularia verruculosa]|uniref:Steroid 5-alpha reductase C-terminal domain-containing protein n=1 Tax=Triangularia verruculosa TaxID=2587418 RepID=A0AAN6X9H9_9PEZI|nr:hypothetical protein QBC40DRAFT_209086 [Triangularia verruculosa]